MAYQVNSPPIDMEVSDLAVWLEEELGRISQDLNILEVIELHVEPDRPFHLQQVLADGTDWNPGSGRGLYFYDEGTATWKFIA